MSTLSLVEAACLSCRRLVARFLYSGERRGGAMLGGRGGERRKDGEIRGERGGGVGRVNGRTAESGNSCSLMGALCNPTARSCLRGKEAQRRFDLN